MPARFVIEFGDVWKVDGASGFRRHVADASGMLAVAWSPDEGCAVAHGSAAFVDAWMKGPKGMAAEALFGNLTVVSFPVHPETVRILNGIVDNPGRAVTLERELVAAGDAFPDLRLPAFVPH